MVDAEVIEGNMCLKRRHTGCIGRPHADGLQAVYFDGIPGTEQILDAAPNVQSPARYFAPG